MKLWQQLDQFWVQFKVGSPFSMWNLDIQRLVAYILVCQLLQGSLTLQVHVSQLTVSGSTGLIVWSMDSESNWNSTYQISSY
ncbi:hypothetical protein VIGAN_04157500 [Vigna angularis var. angularis]|uniref:Uncharacterized protein n=1 Tax=Vigna angularis var. angularis TaxID=157739 RepID=A0A0S3RUJ4_PHAAN|nr:hypothetical protein VIGAN_04157500 [Vigna angularis var. angularis]